MTKAVLFDLFGTLVDVFSFSRYERVLERVTSTLGADHRKFRELWVGSYRRRARGEFQTTEENLLWALRRLNLEVEPSRVRAAEAHLLSFARRALAARPERLTFLESLRSRGLRLGVVTNCSPDIPLIWPETGWHSLFDAACFSCRVGETKPAPGIYRHACRALAVDAGDCLFVGDGSDRELTGARNAGIQAVLLQINTEDAYDEKRSDVLEWDGPSVSALSDIVRFLEPEPALRG